MSDQSRNSRKELAKIMNALADSVTEMTDEEVRAELAEADQPVPSVKDILRKAVKQYRQRDLIAAQKSYEERVTALKRKPYNIPDSPAEQRRVLDILIANNASVRTMLTAQFRDFKEVPDSDLRGILEQLIELGILPSDQREDREL
jgi:hypothetical protein